MADNGFPYGIGAEYNGTEVAEDGFDIVEIPAHTYAVFVCRGRMPDAFREIYRRICTEFFPQNTAYEYGSGVELEVYPSADVQNSDYTCEIWIAVKEKKNWRKEAARCGQPRYFCDLYASSFSLRLSLSSDIFFFSSSERRAFRFFIITKPILFISAPTRKIIIQK